MARAPYRATIAIATIVAAAATSAQPVGRGKLVQGRGVAWTGDATDNETNTTWNKAPAWRVSADGTRLAIGLNSFEGIEEPNVRWVEARKAVEPDRFPNITERPGGILHFFLRYRGAPAQGGWWDGDQRSTRSDRQRAEVKGIGERQRDGETYEYATTFRTDPAFKVFSRFCHLFQVKATDGDKPAPLVTLSLRSNGNGVLQYFSGNDGFRTAATFNWKPGVWQTVRIRLKTSAGGKGALQLSTNGGPFQGVVDVPMFRPDATEYRPKWGLYRGTVPELTDAWVEHRNISARKLWKRPSASR